MSRPIRAVASACLTTALSVFTCADCSAQADELSVFEPSLKTIPVPSPTTIDDYIADRAAAARLGKALFWDVRLGSDGKTACATCHHQAGADPRVVNTMHPGFNAAFSSTVTGRKGARVDLSHHALRQSRQPIQARFCATSMMSLVRKASCARHSSA